MAKNIKEVYLIFKTHLDIGYTDYANTIMKTYLEKFIPSAIRVGNELKGTDTPFVWTVGSYMVWEALKHDTDGSVEQAIKDGIITWHGLPFTSHTEVMSKKLFEYGLSLSQKLDERFGKKTVGSKMTDVPGHTIGMVPLMCKVGLKFLHIGVNVATPCPEVPPIFKWRLGDDEIIVMYEKSYGSCSEFDDFAICFAHTNDNNGPQSKDEIIAVYDKLKKQYPDAKIHASTLDDVAERVWEIKNLPILEKEIGDSWIYGTGSDPKKVAMYRELLRYIEDKDLTDVDLSDNLLLVPEHTWGMCLMRYYPEFETWENKDFKKTEGSSMRKYFERSWEEQREYVYGAEKVLGYTCEKTYSEPDLTGAEAVAIPEDKEMPFAISWQLFDNTDYTRFMHKYTTLTVSNAFWAIWDFYRYRMPDSHVGGIYNATVTEAYVKGDVEIWRLDFEAEVKERYSLPHFWVTKEGGKFDFRWFGKDYTKLPEACWLKFRGFREDNWKVRKMDNWVEPKDVLCGALLMATDGAVSNGDVTIKPIDSHLVAPFGRRLLDYDFPKSGEDLYFNLFNNVYSTNFPIWYRDDSRFRFEIEKCEK